MKRVVMYAMAVVMCVALVAGCSKGLVPQGAEYSGFSDTMASQETGTITELYAATLKALENLELPVSYKKKDNLVAVVQTFTAQGQSVKVLIEFRSVDVSLLTLTTPDEVDGYKLAGLLEEIRRNMSVI